MNREQLLQLKKIDFSNVVSSIDMSLRQSELTTPTYFQIFYTAYVLYTMQKAKIGPYKNDWSEIESVPMEVRNDAVLTIGNAWEVVENNYGKFSLDELMACMLFMDGNKQSGRDKGNTTTTEFISKLASRILDIKDNEFVLELCSGTGCFLTECLCNSQELRYKGIELNYQAISIAKLKASLIGFNGKFIIENAITYREEEKADKIFADYPFGLRLKRNDVETSKIIDRLQIKQIENSSDWLFALSAVEQLSDTGKAAVLIPSGRVWNQSDRSYRQFFVENGYIESVITLPESPKIVTSTALSMLVLSKGNRKIRFTDASSVLSEKGKKACYINDMVDEIIALTENASESTVIIPNDAIVNEEYTLNPARYLISELKIENGIELGQLAKNIKRGCQASPKQIEELRSNVTTKLKYVSVKDINDGRVSGSEPFYLKATTDELKRFSVKNGTMLLSKIGYPEVKAAIVDLEEGEEIIVETLVNPYYVLAFLLSDKGKAMLKSMCTGTKIPMMSIEVIKKLLIPVPDRKEQDKIGTAFAAGIDEIAILNNRLEKVRNRISHIFDEEV